MCYAVGSSGERAAKLLLNVRQCSVVAEGAARGDHCPAGVLPYTVPLVPNLDKSELSSDGGDHVSACHGSVLVGEQGEAGDRLSVPGGGGAACQPHRFDGDGEILPHGLLCVVCLATCPHCLAGGEVGCH